MLKILIVIMLWAICSLPAPALAACTTQTVMLPDGRMMFCTTCCQGGICNTTCI